MTTKECNSRDRRMVQNIQSMFQVNRLLRQYAAALQVTIENSSIVVHGELPSSAHKAQLVPAIRQAGILYRVSDNVRIAA